MIAAFGLAEEPEPGVLASPRNVESVHLTLLRDDGKADVEKPKIVIGSPGVLPIMLAPPNDLLGLAITEGIEDALTVHEAIGLGAWAAGSAGRMPKFADAIPSYIECVTIFAHNDENGAGQDGADQLAQALYQRGIEVSIEGLR
jgi:putative DNA primase/helicase